jgi:hypothetical protein
MHKTEWPNHIAALNDSGLSARAYARQHDLVYSQLIYWKRKLTAAEVSDPLADGFVAVKLATERPSAACLGTLEFPTGVRLHIHSPQLLPGLSPYLGVSALP